MHSASTASSVGTLKDHVEATWHLATEMSVVMGFRGGQPLEVFRGTDGDGPAVSAPKATANEPCLTLVAPREEAVIHAGYRLPEEGDQVAARCAFEPRRAAKDQYGVLRTAALSQLSRAETPELLGSLRELSPSTDVDDNRSNSSNFSLGGVSNFRSQSGSPGWAPASSDGPGAKRQLVLLFDSLVERDLCLEELGLADAVSGPCNTAV
ncbi:unnamed protein product [Prorocentrum cordatum]|uniref:Uncharacterized protein n=1 Tax=Prorocentrum cordatum TaxID=2364126 RepID=A0ABN9U049_9DINO|nr:unnamed protein product [Polarella glacialis]